MIFHNLREYDSDRIMQENGKFERKMNVITNGLEKYMSFMLGKSLSFYRQYAVCELQLRKCD